MKSINASGHKFGLAPLGVGWVVWRDADDLPDDLIFNVNYLGGNMPTFALNFSRPGGQIVGAVLQLPAPRPRGLPQGPPGLPRHRAVPRAARSTTLGPFEIIYDGDPQRGIPALSWKLREGVDHGFTLFDLADRLRTRGWQVPAYTLPPNRDLAVQRILVRHGFSRDLAELLMEDIAQALAHFDKHPVSAPLTEQEAGGFAHS